MNKLKINDQVLRHIGKPLTAFILGNTGWGGRSNFISDNQKAKPAIVLLDLNNCFYWIRKWCIEPDYKMGFVLDYATKTIYYDKKEALDYLLEKSLPATKLENYFTNFIQKDFAI